MGHGSGSESSWCSKVPIILILILQILTVAGLALNIVNYYNNKDDEDKDAVCSTNRCQNGGICMDEGSTITCGCTPGYIGTYCQYENLCFNHTCLNGGSCSISVGVGPICACVNGYSGEKCEIDKDQCSPNPCSNGGECTQIGRSYRCLCDLGFIGTTCEKADPCVPNPCKHNGSCSATGNTYHCTCATQYAGKMCELDNTVDTDEPQFQKMDVAIASISGANLFILILMCVFMIILFFQNRRKI